MSKLLLYVSINLLQFFYQFVRQPLFPFFWCFSILRFFYRETIERVNVEFEGDTISYQQKASYKFRPDLSKGKSSDRLWVPNIPLIVSNLCRINTAK